MLHYVVFLVFDQQNSASKEHHFCNAIYLPNYLPSIFCFFLEGALGLANPYVPFSFLLAFSFDFLSSTILMSSKAPD